MPTLSGADYIQTAVRESESTGQQAHHSTPTRPTRPLSRFSSDSPRTPSKAGTQHPPEPWPASGKDLLLRDWGLRVAQGAPHDVSHPRVVLRSDVPVVGLSRRRRERELLLGFPRAVDGVAQPGPVVHPDRALRTLRGDDGPSASVREEGGLEHTGVSLIDRRAVRACDASS